MQVVYKKTVLEKIDSVIKDAALYQKKIDKIILNRDEWVEFCELMRPIGMTALQFLIHINKEYRYEDVLVECEV